VRGVSNLTSSLLPEVKEHPSSSRFTVLTMRCRHDSLRIDMPPTATNNYSQPHELTMAPGSRYPIDTILDDRTSALILELQLSDLEELLESENAQPDSPTSDFKNTLFQREEMQQKLTIIKDRQMCRSIACAVLADEDAIREHVDQERSAEADRAVACKLAGRPDLAPTTATPPQTPRASNIPRPSRLMGGKQAIQVFLKPEGSPPQTPGASNPALGNRKTPAPSKSLFTGTLSSQTSSNKPPPTAPNSRGLVNA